MARARNIKPGFFKDAKVVACSFEARLLFQGLWCLADYMGRLKYVPIELKMEIFPADGVDIEKRMEELASVGLIQTYLDHSGSTLVQIRGFSKHQNPHLNERMDKDKKPLPHLPGPDDCKQEKAEEKPDEIQKVKDALVVLREYYESDPADSLNLIPDSLKKNTTSTAARFDEFWDEYPKKAEKKKALTIWKRRKLDSIADTLIADIKRRKAQDRKWIEGYIPNPTTYLNGDRWEDELSPANPVRLPRDFQRAWEILDACGLPVGSDSREAQERMLNDHLASHPEDRSKVEAML